jgi:hypothetical protein
MADAGEGLKAGAPLALKVTTAYGPSFQAAAEHFVGEGAQGYWFTIPDRKDVTALLSGRYHVRL